MRLGDYDCHQCCLCGTYVLNGYETDGARHWLSDCRPDLVKHDPGKVCTWHGLGQYIPPYDCYAYQDKWTLEWTADHNHFYEDGPI